MTLIYPLTLILQQPETVADDDCVHGQICLIGGLVCQEDLVDPFSQTQ